MARGRAEVDVQARLLVSRLRAAREAMGFTQDDVADATGIPRSTVQYVERGRNYPRLTTLLTLANFYGLTLTLEADHDDDTES